jgi:diaminopimelate decarboxylase
MDLPELPYPHAQDEGLRLTFALDQIRDVFDEHDDPEAMFAAILRLLSAHFHASHGAIVLLAEEDGDVEALVSSGLGQGEALDLCRAAMRSARPATIDNPYWPHTIGNQIELRGQPLGGLVLVREDQPFSDDDCRLLQIAETQLDSAIVQARMVWKLSQRERELEAIYAIDGLRDTVHDEQQLMDIFARELRERLKAAVALIIDRDGVTIRAREDGRGLDEAALAGLLAHAAQASGPQTLEAPPGMHSLFLFVAPLVAGRMREGLAIIGRDALFTIADQRLLTAMLSQFDTALVHHRLLREAQSGPTGIPISAAPLTPPLSMQGGSLHLEAIPLAEIAAQVGTPAYVYSLKRLRENLERVQAAFPEAELRFSAKSNHNPDVFRTVHAFGAGVDAVSAGEIHQARRVGVPSDRIVFAGVGKTLNELYYAVARGIGWFNVENPDELHSLNVIAGELETTARVALRLNPGVSASTLPHIATGGPTAKFGLSAEHAHALLEQASDYAHLRIEGIHIHIGSQLADVHATQQALEAVLALARPFPFISTINLGGGFPVAYRTDVALPSLEDFASAVRPMLAGYRVILEPGRVLTADAGVLLARVVAIKDQGGRRFVILDTGMTDLIRPMLYHAPHAIVPLEPRPGEPQPVTIVGPVCESTDQFASNMLMPPLQPGDALAILTAGAYGAVMASTYNVRMRPPEVVIAADGQSWRISRRRETWDDFKARDMP